jgi:hypothetical protein
MAAGSYRRKGCKQRKRMLEDAMGSEPLPKVAKLDSELALDLLQKWSVGKCSAAEVQSVAKKSLQDQHRLLRSLGLSEELSHKSLQALASLGGGGRS